MSANVKFQDLSVSSFDHQISVEGIKGGCFHGSRNSCNPCDPCGGNGNWFGFPNLPRFGGFFRLPALPFFSNPFAPNSCGR